jgi:hypothetical protein
VGAALGMHRSISSSSLTMVTSCLHHRCKSGKQDTKFFFGQKTTGKGEGHCLFFCSSAADTRFSYKSDTQLSHHVKTSPGWHMLIALGT